MKVKSFDDIVGIDKELASLFLRPDEAVNWIYAVNDGIKEWIGKHNKQYWEVVRFVSMQRGILGKYRKDKKSLYLTRKNFANVLLTFCPNAVEKEETVDALKSSMEHFELNDELKGFDKLFEKHILRTYVKEVEDLLDGVPPIERHEEASKPTSEELVEMYLRREIDEQTQRFPKSKVCIRPQYGDVFPAISVETYKSQLFLNERRASNIEVYEFVDGVLQESKLNELIGQYCNKRMKLFIVSSHGLLPRVRAKAIDRGIGFVCLNPNAEMTSDNYILPRSIEDYTKRLHDLDAIMGKRPLSTPLLIMDGSKVTSSLADVLIGHGVVIKKNRQLNIPYLKDEIIEQHVNALIGNDVIAKKYMLNNYSIWNSKTPSDLFKYNIWHSQIFSIDPFSYAESLGLSYNCEDLNDDHQLGRFDVKRKHITLNLKGMDNKSRSRFTMAHELGHYLLHAPLFQQQGVVSIGESENTLSLSKENSRWIEIQANKFASYFLMPKDVVVALYALFFENYIHQKFGDSFHPLYYNPNQPETWQSYNNIVVKMARYLGVSKQAMEIRLKSLNLLTTSDRGHTLQHFIH